MSDAAAIAVPRPVHWCQTEEEYFWWYFGIVSGDPSRSPHRRDAYWRLPSGAIVRDKPESRQGNRKWWTPGMQLIEAADHLTFQQRIALLYVEMQKQEVAIRLQIATAELEMKRVDLAI
jgi:hypothetical protein